MKRKEKQIDFSRIGYQDFARMALNPKLSKYEKIGFPDSYRKGFEVSIFGDIKRKVPALNEQSKKILDIGPGCSELIKLIIRHCKNQDHRIHLIDSPEMLEQLENKDFVTKHPGFYPNDFNEFLMAHRESFDGIICYSVFHYIFNEANVYEFLDNSLSLLNSGGCLLIGDIPNISKRNRFFSSSTGIKYHKKFMKDDSEPPAFEYQVQHHKIDDGVIFSILLRSRNFGYEAYLVPQNPDLPMANRREDIIIIKN